MRRPPWLGAALATFFGQPVTQRAGGAGNRVLANCPAAGTFPARPASAAGANTPAGGAEVVPAFVELESGGPLPGGCRGGGRGGTGKEQPQQRGSPGQHPPEEAVPRPRSP